VVNVAGERRRSMKIASIASVAKEAAVSPLFTGPGVTRQVLLPDSTEYRINIVHFDQGVRNKWHTHDSEQILLVTAGRGIVATDAEERVVGEGDIIAVPAGEKHWHGATPDSAFSHLYWFRKGSTTKQLED
jgi:quercetin dioxygenase-like cupin family protein